MIKVLYKFGIIIIILIITSVGEERELICLLSFTCYLLCGFCSERFPLGAWDGQHYFIVALPEPSIQLYDDMNDTIDEFGFRPNQTADC